MLSDDSVRTCLGIAFGAAAALCAGGPALAQDSGAPVDSGLEEIVVSVLKRETKLQDTALTISAATGDALQNQGISDMSQLVQAVPSVRVTDNDVGAGRVTIRNIATAGEATAGLYYDETPIAGSPGAGNDPGGSAAGLEGTRQPAAAYDRPDVSAPLRLKRCAAAPARGNAINVPPPTAPVLR
jgi:outer membrane receptor protein involved in Fe transport